MTVYRVLEALEKNGWPNRFLSWDRRVARLGLRQGEAVFEPFNRFIRWLNPGAALPISNIVVSGTRIRFDPTLSRDRLFDGFVESGLGHFGVTGTSRSPIPLGEFLPISLVEAFRIVVANKNDIWVVSPVVLTYLTEVSIDTDRF